MSKIELGLHDHHAAYQASNLASTSMSSYRNGEDNVGSHGIPEAPFARVNSVVTGSPADQAGLKAGDRIRKFENVNFMNHERLSKIAEAVQRNRGVSYATSLQLKVLTADGSAATFTCEDQSRCRGADLATHPKR